MGNWKGENWKAEIVSFLPTLPPLPSPLLSPISFFSLLLLIKYLLCLGT